MTYLKNVFSAENLPSWISLIALIAVLVTLDKELSRSEIEKEKDLIVAELSESTLPIKISSVRDNPKKLQALSELVSDKIVIPTALGYEPNRFTPRLHDDIQAAVKLVLPKYQAKEGVAYIPKTCPEITALVNDVDVLVMKLENLRGGKVDAEFREYLQSHRDVIIKQLVLATTLRKGDYESVLGCFNNDMA